MSEFNTGRIRLNLRDAHGDLLTDTVRLEFRNLQLSSLNFDQTIQLAGNSLILNQVPAFPRGSWHLALIPQKYRFKQVFVEVPSNGLTTIDEPFFVNPEKVTPVFPSDKEFKTDPRWKPLIQRITPALFSSLNNEEKAGLLNLYAKMRSDSAANVFDFVEDIFLVKPARIFAQVRTESFDRVQQLTGQFNEASGLDHKFPRGWTRLPPPNSFKTPDPTGNLQLTFGINDEEATAVDADLDDHQGIQHAFDVIKHKLTGTDTHPYDIHEVLVRFQNIDPGYKLV